jgi:hypothetical protein
VQYAISLLLAFLCYFLITRLTRMFHNILFTLVFCFVFLISILRILCFCIVFVLLCTLYLLLCCLFPIFVPVFRPLPTGGNPIAVKKYHVMKRWSRVSAFVAATRLVQDYLTNRSAVLDRGKKFFSFPKCPGRLWELTNPGFFLGCKAVELPTSAEVKNK